MLSMQALLQPHFDLTVTSQRIHAGNESLASSSQWHRSGIAVASQRLHAVSVGFALASQWHCSVFTLATQNSLRLRDDIVESSR